MFRRDDDVACQIAHTALHRIEQQQARWLRIRKDRRQVTLSVIEVRRSPAVPSRERNSVVVPTACRTNEYPKYPKRGALTSARIGVLFRTR